MRWPTLLILSLCMSCTAQTSYQPFRDPPDYNRRVIEDVTAMLEGMAAAHAGERIVLRDPNIRSSRQPK